MFRVNIKNFRALTVSVSLVRGVVGKNAILSLGIEGGRRLLLKLLLYLMLTPILLYPRGLAVGMTC